MQMDLFEVAGTTFRFPAVPEDADPRAAEILTERREKILAKARKVKREKTAWKAPRETRVRPGDGTFVPEEGAPGSRITLDDGREAEVWSAAPGARRVWALLEDGTCVAVRMDKYGNHVQSTWKWDAERRAERIAHAAEKNSRARETAVKALVAAGVEYPAGRYDEPGFNGQYEVYKREQDRAKAWALAWISHEMFPEHYPAPEPFASQLAETVAA